MAATPKRIIEITDKVIENKLLEDAKLNWIEVRATRLTAVENEGRHVAFIDRGKPVKADTGGAKVTIAGHAAKALELKAGLNCDISYLGDGDSARRVECR